MRTISEPERRTLKSATDGAYLLAGGVSCIDAFTRVSIASLSKYASLNTEYDKHFIPLDIAVEVDRRAKSPVLIKAAAGILGYEVIPLKQHFHDHAPLAEKDAHYVLQRGMALYKAIHDAFADDGKVDALERKIIIAEARKATQAIDEVLQRLEAQP